MSVNNPGISKKVDVNAYEFQRDLGKAYTTGAVRKGEEGLKQASTSVYNRVMGAIMQDGGQLTPSDQQTLERHVQNAARPKRQVAQLQPAAPPPSPSPSNAGGASSSSGTATPEGMKEQSSPAVNAKQEKPLPFGTQPTAFKQAEKQAETLQHKNRQ